MKIKRTGIIIANVLTVVSFLTTSATAQICATPECVLSSDIKKADGGFSGQNTAAGSGIKTDHIQDGAVTSSKIGIGEIKANNISSGAVTSAKIASGVTVSYATSAVTADFVPATGITGTIPYAAAAGTVAIVPASSITGTVPYAARAGSADSVPAAGIVGTVGYASTAGSASSVPASGIVGPVANATHAGTAAAVPAAGITGLIGGNKLAPGSVTSATIADGAIGTVDLANSAVTAQKIGYGAVTSTALAANAVGPGKIAANSVNNAALTVNSVTAQKISAINAVLVECNGSCGDSNLGQICDGILPGWEPVSVSCTHVRSAGGYPCGGNNICANVAVVRQNMLNTFCEDGNGYDAIVFCMAP